MLARVRRYAAGITPVDAALALGLLVIGLADALTTADYAGGTARLCVAVALQTLPLALRRARTVTAVSLSLVGVVVEVAGVRAYGGVYGLVGFLLLVHAVSRWTFGAQRRTGVVLLIAGAVAHLLSQSPDGPLGAVGDVFLVGVFGTAAWLIGAFPRRSVAAEAAWEARSAAVVEQERARISRELHDVVGHALAGISLTAGAAEQQQGARDPEMASALALIRTTSRNPRSTQFRLWWTEPVPSGWT